jgi:hypothetical protein
MQTIAQQEQTKERVKVGVMIDRTVDRAVEIEVARRGDITKAQFVEDAIRAHLKRSR